MVGVTGVVCDNMGVMSGTPDGTVECCQHDVGRNKKGRSSRGRPWKEGKNQG